MTVLDEIRAYGHENIRGTHKTTIEITKEKNLTKKGNCIIGIYSSKACFDLDPELKKNIQNQRKIKVTLKTENLQDSFYGYGNKELKLLNKNDIVFRTSNYLCDRTVLIKCSKSSLDLNRDLIEKLKTPGKKISIIFEINELNGEQ
ncbi:MAG: DUF371 domain-containing protein [Promethearchaeota archaeon]